MTRRVLLASAALAVLLQSLSPCWAENRQPAGGAFMNSYTSDPYFDPKSLYSQTHSTGDIGGAPMLAEPPGFDPPCGLADPACARAWERRHGR